MRKRSKYRPKGVIIDAMTYVKVGLTPLTGMGDPIHILRMRNHGAMMALTQGKATKPDIDVLINAVNITEALWRMGIGVEYKPVVIAGLRSLRAVAERGAANAVFVLKPNEMADINEALELHDAQIDFINVRQIEQAMEIVKEEIRNKRATPIKETA
tara:strand:+ start:203 stop:673 length:471 start_codon:yes stop_codon:yes gene_type:complete